MRARQMCFFFFFNDTATTEIYTFSLHDALPIYAPGRENAPDDLRQAEALGQGKGEPLVAGALPPLPPAQRTRDAEIARSLDRKSTRLNSSHLVISYAVFCLKKKHSMSSVSDNPP